jgi:hypothetical protein
VQLANCDLAAAASGGHAAAPRAAGTDPARAASTIPPVRLLLLVADTLPGEGLRDYLGTEGHVVEWCASLKEVRAIEDEPFDAPLVDWQLPDGSGINGLRAPGVRRHAVDAAGAGAEPRERSDARRLSNSPAHPVPR